jgi:hypothetical protein
VAMLSWERSSVWNRIKNSPEQRASGSQEKVSNLSNKRAKWVTEDEVTANKNLGRKDKTSNWRTNQWRGWRPGGRGRGGHRGGRGGRPGRARGPRY